MNKRLFPILLAGVLLSACKHGNAPTPGAPLADTLSFDSVSIDTVIAIEGFPAGQAPASQIQLNLKYARGPHAEAINDTILNHVLRSAYVKPDGTIHTLPEAAKSFVDAHAFAYKTQVLQLISQHQQASYGTLSNQYIEQVQVREGIPGSINYLIGKYEFTGGAHGLTTRQNLLFQKDTGERIMLSDLFRTDYEKKLIPLMIDALAQAEQVDGLKGLQAKGIFSMEEPYIPENFILRPDALILLFNQGEVASMAQGPIDAIIPFEQIRGLLRQ